ncbi:MAG: carbon starvation protein A [Lentisphaerae bacterium]|jgi:carbon starvation protein CstA|nr:carbon starvation protein A [Lentisphaerota bacterium]
MISFLIGIFILVAGYFTYGRLVERIFGPDERPTPAIGAPDGVDRLPLPHWKNMLIHLLNIAGIGPVIGVILGIKFGAIVFILLPIGNVIGGAVHDYFSGMISMRHNGANTPLLVRRYLGPRIYHVYALFLAITLLLVGTVFVNTPANILVQGREQWFWVAVAVIFIYYFVSAFFPIDQIIGRIYPIFGAILLLSSIAVLIGLLPHTGLLKEINLTNFGSNFTQHPAGEPVIPMLFVTIACGIISGFHSTQAPIVSRTMTSERQGRAVFYGMMIVEGLIGMIWAAGGMALYAHQKELLASGNGPMLLTTLANWLLHPALAQFALLGVVVLAITSGDTALRSLRLVLAEYFSIDQKPIVPRLLTTLPIFAAVFLLLIWSNASPDTFKVLWNYFSWSNQVIAVFALLVAVAWLRQHGKPAWVAVVPALFMTFIVLDYILFVSPTAVQGAPLGFGLRPQVAASLAAVLAAIIVWLVWYRSGTVREDDQTAAIPK